MCVSYNIYFLFFLHEKVILFNYRTVMILCSVVMFSWCLQSCVPHYSFLFSCLEFLQQNALILCFMTPVLYLIFSHFMSYVAYITCPNLLTEQLTFSSSLHKYKKISKTIQNSFRRQLDLSLVATWRTKKRSGKSAERGLRVKAHVVLLREQ